MPDEASAGNNMTHLKIDAESRKPDREETLTGQLSLVVTYLPALSDSDDRVFHAGTPKNLLEHPGPGGLAEYSVREGR